MLLVNSQRVLSVAGRDHTRVFGREVRVRERERPFVVERQVPVPSEEFSGAVALAADFLSGDEVSEPPRLDLYCELARKRGVG